MLGHTLRTALRTRTSAAAVGIGAIAGLSAAVSHGTAQSEESISAMLSKINAKLAALESKMAATKSSARVSFSPSAAAKKKKHDTHTHTHTHTYTLKQIEGHPRPAPGREHM